MTKEQITPGIICLTRHELRTLLDAQAKREKQQKCPHNSIEAGSERCLTCDLEHCLSPGRPDVFAEHIFTSLDVVDAMATALRNIIDCRVCMGREVDGHTCRILDAKMALAAFEKAKDA